MSSQLQDAQRRLELVLGFSPELAARVVAETMDALSLDLDAYITQRHRELQIQGVANREIYRRISAELPSLRFTGKRLSERQIRRRIYG